MEDAADAGCKVGAKKEEEPFSRFVVGSGSLLFLSFRCTCRLLEINGCVVAVPSHDGNIAPSTERIGRWRGGNRGRRVIPAIGMYISARKKCGFYKCVKRMRGKQMCKKNVW